MRQSFHSTEQFLGSNVATILDFLQKDGFITKEEDSQYKLSVRGFIATHLREIHCLVFAKLLEENKFDILDTKQLIGIFSCFTNITIADEQKSLMVPLYANKNLQEIMGQIASLYNYYQDFETLKQINTGIDYVVHYDLIDYTIAWAQCESAPECKAILQRLEKEKGVFLGEFVKAILKINNIASEMEKIAESIGNIALLSKLREIPTLTQKFVATNQSLYV
jgi:superfamily II RNA helicase